MVYTAPKMKSYRKRSPKTSKSISMTQAHTRLITRFTQQKGRAPDDVEMALIDMQVVAQNHDRSPESEARAARSQDWLVRKGYLDKDGSELWPTDKMDNYYIMWSSIGGFL